MLEQPTNPATTAVTPVSPGSGSTVPADTEVGLVAVVSYPTYAEAARAVNRLSDLGFRVQPSAIVGRGLTSFEQPADRLAIWRAGTQSAISGTVLGALFGWLFGPFSWVSPLISGLFLAAYGAVFGVLIGALLGLLTHAMTGSNRNASSATGLRADHYEILVDVSLARQVHQLLTAIGAPETGPP